MALRCVSLFGLFLVDYGLSDFDHAVWVSIENSNVMSSQFLSPKIITLLPFQQNYINDSGFWLQTTNIDLDFFLHPWNSVKILSRADSMHLFYFDTFPFFQTEICTSVQTKNASFSKYLRLNHIYFSSDYGIRIIHGMTYSLIQIIKFQLAEFVKVEDLYWLLCGSGLTNVDWNDLMGAIVWDKSDKKFKTHTDRVLRSISNVQWIGMYELGTFSLFFCQIQTFEWFFKLMFHWEKSIFPAHVTVIHPNIWSDKTVASFLECFCKWMF
jgi:hypothetical protein